MHDLTAIFNEIQRLDQAASHSESERKDGGITYTPVHIARAMVCMAAPSLDQTIHEPSCGRGMFVFALAEYFLQQGASLEALAAWGAGSFSGCDLDAQAIVDLQRLWQGFFLSQGVNAPPLNVQATDGLSGLFKDQNFDLIVGNPPYVRIQNLPPSVRTQIREQFPSCAKGNVDLYYAFLEDAARRAKKVVYIMPNSWFSNQSAQSLRQTILPRLTHIVDFGTELVFAPVRAYTAIVVLDAAPASSHIHIRSTLPLNNDWPLSATRTDKRFDAAGWTPLHARPTHQGRVLGDVVEVISGIATLADPAFTLPTPRVVEIQGRLFVEQDDALHAGHTLCVPIEFAPRLIKATKFNGSHEGARILCPYDPQWNIVPEPLLQQKAPDLLSWLNRRRTQLEGRDKGKTHNYEAWYAYGRRQGFWRAPMGEDLFMLPQMGNGSLKIHPLDRAILGDRFLFTSGFVLRPKNGTDMKEVAHYLQSPAAWAYVEREGKGWAGKGEYRTLGAKILRQMPYPG